MKTKWKIKTNKEKFKIVPITVKKKNDIVIDGTQLEYATHAKVLGLTIGRTGITKHVEELVEKGRRTLKELYRFYNLPTNIKIHLIKAFIIPILQYPPIPLITISKTNTNKLQKIQNKALRFAFEERYPYTRTTKHFTKYET